LNCTHILDLKGPQPRKIDIAAKGSLQRGCHHALVEAAYAISLVDVLTGSFRILEDVILQVDGFQLPWGQHERHLDILERLQKRSSDHATHHPEEPLIADHNNAK
jgi:hypothetical protein